MATNSSAEGLSETSREVSSLGGGAALKQAAQGCWSILVFMTKARRENDTKHMQWPGPSQSSSLAMDLYLSGFLRIGSSSCLAAGVTDQLPSCNLHDLHDLYPSKR